MLKELLLKYNRPGPRYTSYPPANFFTSDFTSGNYISALKESNEQEPKSISLYFHVPFCPQICHFCGCNTDKMLQKSVIELYFKALLKELDNVANLLSKDRYVTQIHWGGGTPNSVAIRHIEEVMNRVQSHFKMHPNSEVAMECSPAYLSKSYLSKLRELGFNRISLGVQDFDDKVLEVVNRAKPRYPIEEIVADIRNLGFEGVNIDLIYGLPLQTKESFLNSVKRAIQIKPDRIVTFSYAHVPWVKGAQKILEEHGLPSPDQKLDMLLAAYNELLESGYQSIGMDHFALPDDELAIAKNEKLLHRNFQGYCTKETTGQVYAIGSTGISQLNGAYAQNSKNTSEYIRLINETGFATEKGYGLSEDEKIIRNLINEAMCNGRVDFKELAHSMSVDVNRIKTACNFNEEKLEEFRNDNLLSFNKDILQITDDGMKVVRNIAMKLDPNLAENVNMYSKTI